MEEEVRKKTLKGYANVKIVGMRHHYKTNHGQRLPNPPPGCPVSLQLEASNPYHPNAIKVINEVDSRHLGYIVRETADALTLLLRHNDFTSVRGIISIPQHRLSNSEVILCQVLLFFSMPPEFIPPMPPQLDFHEDLSSPFFTLVGTSVASSSCTLEDYDAYVRRASAPLYSQQPRVKQLFFLRPCSTNATSPVHVHDDDDDDDDDANDPLDPPPQSKSQVEDATQRNKEDACMKCKQRDASPLFQCATSNCRLLIHKSCIGEVEGDYCHFCVYLTRRREYHQSRKKISSSCVAAACKSEYKKAREIAIRFLGESTFRKMRELAGLDPLPPSPQVQLLTRNTNAPSDVGPTSDHNGGLRSDRVFDQNKKGTDPSPSSEAQTRVLASERNEVACMKYIEKSAAKKKKKEKEKEVVGRGKRRLPPRPSLDRSCKKRIQASPPPYLEKPSYLGRRRNLPFTEEEEELLKQGVEKYANKSKDGTMSWKDVLEYGKNVFDKSRTTMDLRDKWRNMMKKQPR